MFRLIRWLRNFRSEVRQLTHLTKTLMERVESLALLAAKGPVLEIKRSRADADPRTFEFKVFSQWGDDGIIQFLIHHAVIRDHEKVFVEFGVESYQEANTRFLLVNDNWRGLVLDADPNLHRNVVCGPLGWQHSISAVSAWISRDNIEELIRGQGIDGEIGLLSVDVDGNDYWMWEAIQSVRPAIVIVEFNSAFGPEAEVSVPYDPSFRRTEKHSSNLYFGCSLKALVELGKRKGYSFVGCNSIGNNAYFVRKERMGGLRELAVLEGYVESKFRESRDGNGNLTYLSGPARLEPIRHLPLWNFATQQLTTVEEMFRPPLQKAA